MTITVFEEPHWITKSIMILQKKNPKQQTNNSEKHKTTQWTHYVS